MLSLDTGLVKWILTSLIFWCAHCAFGQTNVLTQHNDLFRTGQNLTETILTPSTVASGNFEKIFSLTVDGAVLAQPLYFSGVKVGGATHNVVFIATEHDSVYAFDADTGGSPLWKASLLDAAHGAASGATSNPESQSGCNTANGEYGISGTPVIDASTGTLYVVSVTYENNYPVSRLHALDITTGLEKLGGPVAISASVSGSGSGSSNGKLTFDPNIESDRAGLALVNGQVYVAFASYCDFFAYHGWLLAYNAATLAQTAVLVTTPNGSASGIWMGAAAPSFDTENGSTRMFITTGNGSYDATAPYATNSMDYGDDILRLDISNGITVADAFTPSNQAILSSADGDLGSTGALILPDQPGVYPHLLIEASKLGVIYVVNRDSLGGYSTTSDNVVQELGALASSTFGSPAYWNGNVYFWPAGGQLRQFTLANGLLSTTPVAYSPQLQGRGLGSSPSISASGATNAIVWSIDSSQSPQVLYAHDATNVANLLWSSAMNPARDSAGLPAKFLVPTIANGKVYVDSIAQVVVYGLPDFSLSSSAASTSIVEGQSASGTIAINPLYGFTGAVTFNASSLPSGVTASFAANTATFTAAANAPVGKYTVVITGTSGTLSHSVNVGLTVAASPPAPDFVVALTPQSLTVTAGNSVTAQISVTPNQTFSGTVGFSCSVANSVAHVTCSVPGTVTGSGSSTLTITTAANATVGNDSVLITAASGTLSHSVSVGLTVASPPAPDFSVAPSPQSVTLTAGNSGTTQISVTPNQTFGGTVGFTCSASSSLANVTCSVPGTVTGSGAVTLTITAAANAATPSFRLPHGNLLLFYLLAGLALAGGAAWFQTRRDWRMAAAGFVPLLGLYLCSCGGGFVTTSPTAKAVSETGLITVVGTSGSLSHSTTVSVTIQ